MVLFNVMVTEWQEPSLEAELLLNSPLAIRLFAVNLMRMTFATFSREQREGAVFARSPGLRENTVYENEVPFLLSIEECSCPSSNDGSVDVLHLRPHSPPPKGFLLLSKLGSLQYECNMAK